MVSHLPMTSDARLGSLSLQNGDFPMEPQSGGAPPGARILDETRSFTGRFCSLPSAEALDAVTLWIAHCHAADSDRRLVFASTPRLAILSDTPGSGKTRLLEVIEMLVPRPVRCTNPTAPA
jgi:hypothetical protein